MIGRVIDRKKFEEEHRNRVIHSRGRIRLAYLDRYEEYAFDNGLKICRECYRLYEKNCVECCKGFE